MTIIENHVYHRAGKKPILLDYYIPLNGNKCPIIIFAHGYKGFKDWGAWSLMGKEFTKAGLCFIKFNFSHNGGTVDQPIDFPDLEAFGTNNYSKELDDLGDVMDWIISNLKNEKTVLWYIFAIIKNHTGSAECASFQQRCKRSFKKAG